MTSRRRSELYRVGIGFLAAATFLAGLKGLTAGRPDPSLVGSLAVAGVLALEFPLRINLSHKVSVAAAVFFAAVLLLGPWQAAALVAAVQAVDLCIVAARKVHATRERPPVLTIGINLAFNAGQAYLATLAAAFVLHLHVLGAAAIVAAAAVMYAANLLMVSTAIGLATSRNPVRLFFNTQRIVYVQYASLYLTGAIAAFAANRYPWVPLLAIVPAVLVYHSLRQRIEMRREAMRAMERMAEEVDRRDPYTFNHSQRVAIYCHAIGRHLRLSAAEVDLLTVAAKVHDIGKIRIPDSVLLKPGKLTPQERRIMETHPRLGFDILKPFSEYAHVLELVLSHHERYDGKGYPNGTVGRHQPLMAQVIPVADSLDAMTTARAYREARSWEAALEELLRGAGTQWNPQVVDAAIAVLAPRAKAASAETSPRPLAHPAPEARGAVALPH